jgi:nucleoside 2-deoxyribosyltransferase
MKIYVASSWVNTHKHGAVVDILRERGHEVYDYRTEGAFHWSDVSPNYKNWNIEEFVEGLNHPLANKAFHTDFSHMMWADVCILVLPCGRSAHLEAGWFVGQNKSLFILTNEKGEPAELTYKMADLVTSNINDILNALK